MTRSPGKCDSDGGGGNVQKAMISEATLVVDSGMYLLHSGIVIMPRCDNLIAGL
jgi:hypothetical protein